MAIPAIIDMDIHPAASKQGPIEPFIPDDIREAISFHLSRRPNMGYANPVSFRRRDVTGYGDPHKTAREHLDPLGITYAVIQPTGMDVSLIHQIDAGSAMAEPGTTGRSTIGWTWTRAILARSA